MTQADQPDITRRSFLAATAAAATSAAGCHIAEQKTRQSTSHSIGHLRDELAYFDPAKLKAAQEAGLIDEQTVKEFKALDQQLENLQSTASRAEEEIAAWQKLAEKLPKNHHALVGLLKDAYGDTFKTVIPRYQQQLKQLSPKNWGKQYVEAIVQIAPGASHADRCLAADAVMRKTVDELVRSRHPVDDSFQTAWKEGLAAEARQYGRPSHGAPGR